MNGCDEISMATYTVLYNDELMSEEAHQAEAEQEHCLQNICCQTETLLWHLFDEPEKLDNQGSTATDYRCITMRTVSPDEGRSLFDSEDLDFEGEPPRCDTDGQDNPPTGMGRQRLNYGGRTRGNTRARQWAILRLLVANEIAIDGDVVPLPIEKRNWEPAAPRADGRISKTQKRRAQAKRFKAKSLAPRGGEVTLVSSLSEC